MNKQHHNPAPFSSHPEPFPEWMQARGVCTRVVDGDTYDITCDLGLDVYVNHRFRLEGVDTPEIFGPKAKLESEAGQAAKARVEELILGKPVLLEIKRRGLTLGRYVARVHYHQQEVGWTSLAYTLVAEGHAKGAGGGVTSIT